VIPPTLYARLDKTGRWVVCCGRDCGERFGEVNTLRERRVIFQPGWTNAPIGRLVKGAPRIWHLPKRVRERIDQGRLPMYRRQPGGNERRRRRERIDLQWEGIQLSAPSGRLVSFRPSAELPAQAQCPRCKQLQWLDAERLQLSS
jgi:hypothetical protein